MRLYFPVPAQAGEDGVLLRSFLRECRLSTDLARAVKFHGGGFFADGRPILANQRVHPGQVVSFALPGEEGGCRPEPGIPVHVAYEDFFALALDKPAGIAVHPTLNYPGGTLANGYAALRAAAGRSTVFRPVNRIDKDTSGLVLAAQNAYAAPLLAAHVEKLYYAVAEGELPAFAAGYGHLHPLRLRGAHVVDVEYREGYGYERGYDCGGYCPAQGRGYAYAHALFAEEAFVCLLEGLFGVFGEAFGLFPQFGEGLVFLLRVRRRREPAGEEFAYRQRLVVAGERLDYAFVLGHMLGFYL